MKIDGVTIGDVHHNFKVVMSMIKPTRRGAEFERVRDEFDLALHGDRALGSCLGAASQESLLTLVNALQLFIDSGLSLNPVSGDARIVFIRGRFVLCIRGVDPIQTWSNAPFIALKIADNCDVPRMSITKEFDTFDEAYNWLVDLTVVSGLKTIQGSKDFAVQVGNDLIFIPTVADAYPCKIGDRWEIIEGTLYYNAEYRVRA